MSTIIENRCPLPEGTVLVCEQNRYIITGSPIGAGGGSLIYPARKEGEELDLIIKEIYPVSREYDFERDNETMIIRPKYDYRYDDALTYLHMLRDTFTKNETAISMILRNESYIHAIPLYTLHKVSVCPAGRKESVGIAENSYAVMERMSDPEKKKQKACLLSELWDEFQKEPEKGYPFRFGGKIPVHISAYVIKEILEALETVHDKHYIHGDLQWSNIFFAGCDLKKGRIGKAVLFDFGASRKLENDELTAPVLTEKIFSTENFRPIELLDLKNRYIQLSAAMDIYAVSYMFFVFCGGDRYISVFEEPAIQLYEDPDLCRINRKNVGCNRKVEQELNRILAKGLASDYKDRYTNASDMLKDISGFAAFAEKESQRKRYTNKGSICPVTSSRSSVLDRTYVRRADLLAKLNQIMSDKEDKKQYAILTAMGGEGKSELARAYAMEHIDSYEDIFWITCRDGEEPELLDLLKKQSCEIEKEDLWELDDLTLMIIDNCNTDSFEFLNQVLTKTGNAHIIITTRIPYLIDREEHILPVVSDDQEEFAYAVFWKNYTLMSRRKKQKTIREEEMFYVIEICHLVEYNPMMVSMIAIELREYENLSIREFADKLQHGLKEASLTGAQIKYDKDGKRLKSDILNILQFVFTDLLHHDFTEKEKQVLTLLKLVPAEHVDQDFLCEILGDNKDQVFVQTACGNLQDYGWLQGNGEWVAVHPLISEVLELDEERTLTESGKRNELYEQSLKNWLAVDEEKLLTEEYFIYRIWKCVNECLKGSVFNLIVSSFLQKNVAKEEFRFLCPEVKFALMAYVNKDGERIFLYYDLNEHKEEVIYKRVFNRRKSNTRRQAKLQWMLCDVEERVLEFPDMILGCRIEEIPVAFCRYKKNITGLKLPQYLVNVDRSAFKGCEKLQGELIIPKTVRKIGIEAFEGCNSFTGRLTIPDGVIEIEEKAFRGCSGFSGNLVIPDSVIKIGENAFYDCDGFSGNLIIPNSVTKIGEFAFVNCSGFCGNLVIPDSVTEIGEEAFCNCKGFSGNLIIPDRITKIESGVFLDCSGFSGNLVIPDSVTEIGSSAFSGCSGFSGNLVIPDSVTKIGERAFKNCSGFSGNLIIPDSMTKIESGVFESCSGFSGNLIIPDSVTEIDKEAFKGCSGFNGNLIIPDSVTKIGKYAFSDCNGLSGNLNIPESVTKIESGVFWGCSGFSGDLVIPDSVTKIGVGAFEGCSGFSGNLIIPDSVTEIGSSTFKDCSGFSGNLIIPDSVTKIDFWTFKGCSGFTGNLVIPDNVTHIGWSAFKGCSGFTGNLVIPDSVTELGEDAFSGCDGLSDNLVIPDSVRIIRNKFFRESNGLTGNLIIPDNVTEIQEYSFYHCDGLTGNLIIPNSVTEIGEYSFYFCSGLTGNLTIPDNVTRIGEGAFSYCYGFTGNLVIPDSVTEIGDEAFSACNGFNSNLVIPDSVTKIGKEAFSSCSGFSGNLIIPGSVIEIGDEAFSWCDGFNGNLIISDGVTKIGKEAFYNCSGFTGNLVIPDSVTEIGDGAFSACNGFNGNLIISDGVKKIGEKAFSACDIFSEYLNSHDRFSSDFNTHDRFSGDLIIPDSVTEIGDGAFYRRDGFSGNLVISKSVTEIGYEAFKGCSGFTGNLVIPDNVIWIGWSAFEGCSGFSDNLVIPDNVTYIGDKAFKDCSGFSGDLVIPDSVTYIGWSAFEGCIKIEKIIIKNRDIDLYNIIAGYTPTICGYKGSTAEEYAKENHFPFEYLD